MDIDLGLKPDEVRALRGLISSRQTSPLTASAQQSIQVTAILNLSGPLQCTLTPSTINIPYNSPVSIQFGGVSGGNPPYTWSVTPGTTLPAGLTLSPSGLLSGTYTGPTVSGFQLNMTITDTPITV